ncbi:TPA: hypothetical protein ACIVNJ_004989 [Salmonella enterica subsp. diarizonae serovar 61:r:-]
MKLYWTLKSIPELTDLPANLRSKNFKDAYNALYTRFEYWAGIVIFFICNITLSRVYNYLFPTQLVFPYSIIRDLLPLFPGLVIWYQFIVHGVRKHYRHILERGKKQVRKMTQTGWYGKPTPENSTSGKMFVDLSSCFPL